jgi:uncharacterized protein YndB with AHSA1/START domain
MLDRIEKEIFLRAPIDRVWRAVATVEDFNAWFGVKLTGEFRPGAHMEGAITYPGYEHVTMRMVIERVEPPRLLAWAWHPGAVDPSVDYTPEPKTHVVFELAEADGGTRLTVVESGFNQLPEARRHEAYRLNDGGWAAQLQNIERHVSAGLRRAG